MTLSNEQKDNYLFSALANMGNASNLMSWANNCVEEIAEVPEPLKLEMKQINSKIHEVQEKLREIRKGVVENG